jgi:hypothetical protein
MSATTAETASPTASEKGEFERVALYLDGTCSIQRIDCRHLKFWWGRYEKSTSQYHECALQFVYIETGQRTRKHAVEYGPRPVYALIVRLGDAFPPPSAYVRDPRNPMVSHQRYGYWEPRMYAEFEACLAAANPPLLADFRGMQPSPELHQTQKQYLENAIKEGKRIWTNGAYVDLQKELEKYRSLEGGDA